MYPGATRCGLAMSWHFAEAKSHVTASRGPGIQSYSQSGNTLIDAYAGEEARSKKVTGEADLDGVEPRKDRIGRGRWHYINGPAGHSSLCDKANAKSRAGVSVRIEPHMEMTW